MKRPNDRFDCDEELGRRLSQYGLTGLTAAVLQAIRTDVFNVVAPIAP